MKKVDCAESVGREFWRLASQTLMLCAGGRRLAREARVDHKFARHIAATPMLVDWSMINLANFPSLGRTASGARVNKKGGNLDEKSGQLSLFHIDGYGGSLY